MTITYIFRSNGTGHSIEEQFGAVSQVVGQRPGWRTKRVQLPHIGRSWRTFRQNMEVARRSTTKADLIHITGDVHYVALALPRSRTVLTIHDCITLEKNRKRPIRFAFFWLFWYYLPIRWAAVVTVVSDKTRQDLIRYVGRAAQNVIVVANGYHPLFTRQPASFWSNCPVLLQVGTAPHKNIARLVAAIEGINCKLLIVGPLEASQLADLKRRQVEYQQYIDLKLSAIVDLYRQCDLVLFVSTYEGFGLPVLEANAVGRTVVTSDLSPLRELAGSAAHLVNPFDVASIRAGILRVMQEEEYRDELIEAGHVNARRYAIDSTVDQYLTIYRQLLHKESITCVDV